MHTTGFRYVLVAVIAGAVSAFATVTFLDTNTTTEDRIAEFYATETAVMVSPHGLRKKMSSGDTDGFVLVDVRSAEEYEDEHIAGALSVPAYKDPNTSAYGDVERIVNSFRDIVATYPDRDIIVYCYSIPCMTGRKVGNMLANHGIYVKELGVGWNEWRYFWTLWNHPHEWEITNVEDYVVSGVEPGAAVRNYDAGGCTLEGEFGC